MITILPVKVKLLHFPRSHLAHVTHAIVKACFFKDTNDPDYFFSFTENAYEISIVAEEKTIDTDFLPALTMSRCVNMDVSSDTFRVMQVDDEGGQDASGKRISDLSEPLALGQFSIFYMSTYQTDFVLIKERRMLQAVQTLLEHGFQFDQDALDTFADEQQTSLQVAPSDSFTPSDVGLPTQALDEDVIENCVLSNQLLCAGLNPHYRSSWALTMLKLLSYPELVASDAAEQTHFFSYTATSDGISLLADQHLLGLFQEGTIYFDQDSTPLRVIQVNLAGSNLDRSGIVRSISHPLATDAHINLMYLSTYKTANIIVSADDIERAEAILAQDLEKMRGMLNDAVQESVE